MKFNLSKLNLNTLDKNVREVLGRFFAISLISFVLLGTALPLTLRAETSDADTIQKALDGNNAGTVSTYNTDASAPGSGISTNTGPATTGQTTQQNGNSLSALRNKSLNDKELSCNPFGKEFAGCIGQLMLSAGGAILSWSGILLNKSIDLSITSMSAQVKSIPAIGFVWTAFRDLSNIFFIFVLIYIAFKTILGMDQKETMHMLIRVIIVGLLINFSLVFTKMTVDVSNVVAIQFYKSIQVGDDPDRGLSAALMDGLKLTTLYNMKDDKGNALVPQNTFLIGLMGMIFYLVTAFVFLAAAIMFIARFVYIIILMMTSPIVFALWMMPGKGPGSAVGKWTGKLVDQLIFAPVFMMMMWVVVMVVSRSQSLVPGLQGATFVSALTGANVDSVSVILNFIVVIALTISAITIAKAAGGSDHGDKIMGWGKALGLGIAGGAVGGAIGLGGWAGRRTLGAGASNILNADENTLRGKFAKRIKDNAPTNTFARLGLNSLKGVSNASFDLRAAPLGAGKILSKAGGELGLNIGKAQEGGFEAKMKAQKERELQKAKDLGEGKVYADDATKAEVKRLEEEKKAHDAEAKKKDEEIAAAKAAGKSANEIKSLEDQKLKAITESTNRKKMLDDINNNPNRTKTRQEAYAASAAKGKAESILGYVARKAGGDGKGVEAFARNVLSTRGKRDAAKELTKEVEKKTEAYNQKWAEKFGAEKAKEIDTALEPLIKEFKAKTDELNAIKKVSSLDPLTGRTVESWAPGDDARRMAIEDQINKTRKQIDDFNAERKKVEPYAKKAQYRNILDAVNSMAGVAPTTPTTPSATPPPAPTP